MKVQLQTGMSVNVDNQGLFVAAVLLIGQYGLTVCSVERVIHGSSLYKGKCESFKV